MTWEIEWVRVIFLALWFGMIVGAASLWRRWRHPPPELTRKAVHLAGGMTSAFFPLLFQSPHSVVLLCFLSVTLMMLGKRGGGLGAVHGVDRKTYGAFYFPVAVAVLFWLGHGKLVFYSIAILVMTFADAFASLVGQSYGVFSYDVHGDKKTLEGSVAFGVVTFLCIHIALLLLTPLGRAECVLISLIVSLLVTGLESISFKGSDNLFVPFLTFYILNKMTLKSLDEIILQTGVLGILSAGVFALSVRTPMLRGSGAIGLILLLYGAWSLCGFPWALPLILSAVILKGIYLVHGKKSDPAPSALGLWQFLQAGITPFIVIFLANSVKDYQRLYIPFLAGIFASTVLLSRRVVQQPRSAWVASAWLLPAIAVPLILFSRGQAPVGILWVILSTLGGTFLDGAIRSFWVRARTDPPDWLAPGVAFFSVLVCLVFTY